jgi:hypothetical protein
MDERICITYGARTFVFSNSVFRWGGGGCGTQEDSYIYSYLPWAFTWVINSQGKVINIYANDSCCCNCLMAFKKMPIWRTVKINLKLSYQSTILNSLPLIRLRDEFVHFAHHSFYKNVNNTSCNCNCYARQHMFLVLLSHYTQSCISSDLVELFFISELKPLPLMTQKYRVSDLNWIIDIVDEKSGSTRKILQSFWLSRISEWHFATTMFNA